MALLILLICCFFQPTWKTTSHHIQRNKTCKLTASYLYTWIEYQPNKLRFFHWISALKPTTKVLQMDTAERGAPDFQWKNQYDNDIFLVDSPSTAASQLVAATLLMKRRNRAGEQLWNGKLEETEASCEGSEPNSILPKHKALSLLDVFFKCQPFTWNKQSQGISTLRQFRQPVSCSLSKRDKAKPELCENKSQS